MPNKSKTDEQEYQKISCKIPRALWRQGKIEAIDQNVDFQDIVVRALEAYLQTSAKKGKEGR
jgi:hypothetical protein